MQSSVTYTLSNANVENLTLTGTSAISGTGNALNNVLTGNSANNTLTGGAGNDTLNGGAGTDTLIGGLGDDLYVIDSTTDTLTENANEGTDTVQSSVTYTLGNNLENLILTGTSAINGTGNILNNTITGNSAGNTLSGGAGADTLIGGLGDDIYVIDNTSDIVTENTSEGTDIVQSSVTYGLSANVENLTLTGTIAINGTGNQLNNVLTGNSANNTLTGGAGNDTFNGGAGTDTLVGGLGDDLYIVDNTTDTLTENTNEGTDTVQSSVTYTLGNNIENLTLTGTTAINATGNVLNNILIGNSAVNTLTGGAGDDYLDGGAGNDKLLGGLGNDTYVVDSTSDTVTENTNEGIDTIRSSVTLTLGNNLENLTLTGTSAINGTGNALNNTLIGNTAVNTLTGGAGDDYLDGGTGADKLLGGTGNDTYVIDNTGDVVTENANEGIDTILSSITYTLGNNLENLTLIGSTAINATGNTLNNTLIGNNGVNVLNSGAGNDILDGQGGNDQFTGGTGADTLLYQLLVATDALGGNGSDSWSDFTVGNTTT
ncbi:MAG: calcium-binding protein, partial [Acinetobacter sp.]